MTVIAPPPVKTIKKPTSPPVEPEPPTPARFQVSALNRRRWQNFKANRRGFWSLWIFLFLFITSLFAECIANDKPFFVEYDGHAYFPALFNYTQADFGVTDELAQSAADYRDPYLVQLIADKRGYMVWPPIRFSYNTQNKNPPMAFPVKPTWALTEKDCGKAGGNMLAMLERQHGFDQPGHAGRRLQVADIGLHRPYEQALWRCPLCPQRCRQRLQLDRIA